MKLSNYSHITLTKDIIINTIFVQAKIAKNAIVSIISFDIDLTVKASIMTQTDKNQLTEIIFYVKKDEYQVLN